MEQVLDVVIQVLDAREMEHSSGGYGSQARTLSDWSHLRHHRCVVCSSNRCDWSLSLCYRPSQGYCSYMEEGKGGDPLKVWLLWTSLGNLRGGRGGLEGKWSSSDPMTWWMSSITLDCMSCVIDIMVAVVTHGLKAETVMSLLRMMWIEYSAHASLLIKT